MAVTAEAAALTDAHRRAQVALRGLAGRDVARILPLLDLDDIAGTWDAVERAIAAVVNHRRNQSSALAARYFDRFRRAEGIRDQFVPRTANELAPDYLSWRLRFAGPVQARQIALKAPTEVPNRLLTSLEGEVSRQVLNAGRETLHESVAADRRCIGVARVTDSNPCAFCAMLASRGPSYKSRGSAVRGDVWSDRVNDFRAHAHCACTAEPVYSTSSEWPGRSREFADLWSKSTRGESGKDALNAFRRALSK